MVGSPPRNDDFLPVFPLKERTNAFFLRLFRFKSFNKYKEVCRDGFPLLVVEESKIEFTKPVLPALWDFFRLCDASFRLDDHDDVAFLPFPRLE
jgi:hypothetical protein